MTMQEIRTLMKYGHKCHQEQWEQVRWLAAVIVNMLSTKEISVTSLLKFPWDDEEKATSNKPTLEQIDNLMERARAMQKNMNNN